MNPLLQQQSPAEQQSQLPGAQQQPTDGSEQPQSGGLTFDSIQVEKSIKEQLPDDKVEELNRMLEGGNKLLFGKETHHQIIDDIQGLEGEQLGAAMGDGAIALTGVLAEKSGGTLPKDLIGSAVTILMIRVAEFVNKTGIANVTDDVLEEALHIFSVKVRDMSDPNFRNELGMNQDQQPEQSQQVDPAQQVPQTPLLRNGGI